MNKIVELIDSAAQAAPSKAAMIDGNGRRVTTYAELSELSKRISAALISKGATGVIPILLPREAESFAAVLGILRAGLAFSPLDSAYPADRISYILRDCGCDTVLDERLLSEMLTVPPSEESVDVSPEAVAAVFYTSGSTGAPKGVLHSGASLLSCVRRHIPLLDRGESSVHASAVSFSFVAMVFDVLTPLCLGATVHILSDEVRKDVALTERYYKENCITSGFLSPQMLKRIDIESCGDLCILTGSERLSDVEPCGHKIINLYGLSETLAGVSHFEVTRAYGNTPIGKPFEGINVYLLDENGMAAQEGEICVSGEIFDGYLNMPEETARVYTPNPFAEKDGFAKLFHTGDLGRWDENGDLVYIDRRDWMVKINGQRVEPGEIESALNSLSQVKQAACKGFTNGYGQTYICAYYTPCGDAEESAIRAQLSEKLPSYMIPLFFVPMEKLPLNSNGKLDRKALTSPDASLYLRAYVPPETALQQSLCVGFQQVLGIERVGIDDDFFSLGGDSVKTVVLQGLLKDSGLQSLDVFSGRTLKGIAELITERGDEELENLATQGRLPLTDSQLGIYLACARYPQSTMYNIPTFSVLPAGTDTEMLKKAIEAVIRSHSAFALRLVNVDGEIFMERGEYNAEAPVYEMTEAELTAYRAGFLRPFDLDSGELYRFAVVKTEKGVYLFTDVHHIISDGASLAIVTRDIGRAYDALEPLPEKADLFSVSAREQKLKDAPRYREAHDFFRDRLDGNDLDSNLTYDKKGLPDSEIPPAGHYLSTLAGSSEAVEHFTRGLGVTENTLFLGAFAYALAVATGQNASLFCTVDNGRHSPALSDTVGMLVRTLPVSVEIDDTRPVGAFLRDVQTMFFDTMARDCFSFESMATEFGVRSDILYVYQAETLNAFDLGGRSIPIELQDNGCALSNLSVMVFKRDGGYSLSLDYRSDRYEPETVERFAGLYSRIVDGILSGKALGDIPLVSQKDSDFYRQCNSNALAYDKTSSVVDLLRTQAKKTPENTAVVFKGLRMTYRELDELTDRLAAYIAGRSIGREDVVSILIPRCEYMPIAAIGVLKSGAGYQPLDPTYPTERLSFMVRDSAARLVIADPALLTLLPEYTGEVLSIRDISKLPQADSLPEGPRPEDLFIMLYTSGTTGVPKGCMLEHKNLVAFCHWYHSYYGLAEDCAVAAYASFGFDANMMDSYPTLTCGAALHIIPEEMRLELAQLNDYFEKNGITHSFMTTQVGRQFATEVENRGLRCLSVGGETLVPCVPRSDLKFYNLYGPTETTVLVTAFQVDREYDNVPIGRAISNVKLYVLDKRQRLLPVGVPGELCIAGAQVARGYLNRPEETAKAFISNPFAENEDESRMYRTGDVVRMLSDGNLEFVGRKDAQVKVRGFRIELTEVEKIIREYPPVTDATVVAKDSPAGGKMVLAYIVSPEKVDIQALNDFILENKPPYMVPAATMQIDKIPLNPNMKVDRRKLPEIKLEIEDGASARAMTELEKELFGMVSEIVGHDSFSVSTDLSAAGLTSLSAIKLASRLQTRYGFSPGVNSLTAHSSVLKVENELVEHLLTSRAGQETRTVELSNRYPLTQTQLGIYLDCQRGGGDAYNIPLLFRLSPAVEPEKLEKAVKAVIKAHPGLLCSIEQDESGQVYMYPRPDTVWSVSRLSMTEEELKNNKRALTKTYDFAKAPLFTVKLITTESSKYLFLETHHIISDGETMGILLREISEAYDGKEPAKESYTLFDLAGDEQAARATSRFTEAKAFYDSVFSQLSVNSLPSQDVFDAPERCDRQTGFVRIDDDRLEARLKKLQITPNAFFTGAFAYVLARFTGEREALFTTIYNGRDDTRTLSMAGMLVKTLPLYARFDSVTRVDDYLQGIREQLSMTRVNDIFSFAEVSHAYGIKADILFAYQGGVMDYPPIAGVVPELITLDFDELKAPLNVDVYKQPDGCELSFEYNGGRFSSELIRVLIETYAAVIDSMLTADTMGGIEVMSPYARERLRLFNDTACPVAYRPAYRLLQDSAEKYPQRTAVIASGEKLTYAELNSAANRIGRSLIARGTSENSIVSLMLERTKYVYEVRQGILKSGGAFLPLDPEYPDERIEFIIKDSGCRTIVVTEDIAERRAELFAGLGLEVLTVEKALNNPESTDPNLSIAPESLAYCIYTSGSTGKPKGVMLTQKNLVNFVDANPKNHEILGYTEHGSVSLALAAITFDVSIMEEFIPLSHGLTICMANTEQIHDPAALRELILSNNVDIMSCTPSFLSNIVDMPPLRDAIARINSYDFGAEAFPPALYGKICAIRPDAFIMNGYGPTEATVSCTMAVVKSASHVTIGRPNANVEIYIVDEQNRVLPPAMCGEMVICGDGVGRGYIGRDDLNREKFITLMGRPAFKSGDLALWTANGEIEFHGRTDDQVKLRGLRVELGEIESAINSYPAVKTSIVVVRGKDTRQFLAAFYTADGDVDKAALTEHLRSSLTAYMVPSVLTRLDEMPLTANRKIDKKRLPEVSFTMAERPYAAPVGQIETDFCNAFADALGLDRVGATDDFFEIGGSSLTASKIAMLAMTKGYAVSYGDVFKSPTARGLAALCASGSAPKPEDNKRDDIRAFDYAALYGVLSRNVLSESCRANRVSIGNALITGATGFLGAHILREYLETESGTAYCLVRGGGSQDAEKRLNAILFYYFNRSYEAEIGRRIICIDGDITDESSVAALKDVPFDTLINCAACVKHFAADDILDKVNVRGVKYLTDLCLNAKKRLVQISTVSIAGEGRNGIPPMDKLIHENELYFGQTLDNAYIHSKFLAERTVLEAAAKGLDAKIMRVGNLMSRDSDGEFQINFITNGFMRQLKGYKIIGQFPISLMSAPVEFSPIDSTARAILKLSGTEGGFTVFHPYNSHSIFMSDVIREMNNCEMPIEVVEDEEFQRSLMAAMEDSAKSEAIGGLIAYLTADEQDKVYLIESDNSFTNDMLYRLGFAWPITAPRYLKDTFELLKSFGFFD